jgi:hypothetical protein
MTPAEELRAAADKLRKLTADLGDCRGPWYVVNREQRPYPQRIDNIGVPYIVASTTTDPSHPPTIADYIVAMHPRVGLALADWLDAAAHSHKCSIQAAGDVFRDDPDGRTAWLTTGSGAPSPEALAVARAILGTTP